MLCLYIIPLFPFRLVFSIHSAVRWMRRQGETAQECVPALQSSKGERSNIQGGASAATPPQRMKHSSRAAIRKEGLPFSAEAGLLPDFTQDNASFPILPHGRWPFSKKAASFKPGTFHRQPPKGWPWEPERGSHARFPMVALRWLGCLTLSVSGYAHTYSSIALYLYSLITLLLYSLIMVFIYPSSG